MVFSSPKARLITFLQNSFNKMLSQQLTQDRSYISRSAVKRRGKIKRNARYEKFLLSSDCFNISLFVLRIAIIKISSVLCMVAYFYGEIGDSYRDNFGNLSQKFEVSRKSYLDSKKFSKNYITIKFVI